MSADNRLLLHPTLVHLDPPRVEQASIRIRGGRIAEVGPDLRPEPGETVDDLSEHWVIPGLTCAHTHLYSALATGMPMPSEAPEGFADMLSKVWWKLDRALDMEGVEVSALVGGVAALHAGVTTLVDHHASPSAITGSLETIDGALDALGLRRLLCYEVTDRGGKDEAIAGLDAHARLLGADGGGMRAMLIGAHANFTLSDETLSAVGAMAKEAGVGVHIHVAESAEDAALTGEDPIDRLERLGALLPGSILAHCVHLDEARIARAQAAGAWITHQPRSNQNNAVGYAPVQAFGPATALGTDGIGADMFAELQAGWFRAQEAGVDWSPDRWLSALSAGAQLAGEALGVQLGRIEQGAAADLVVLDPPVGPPLSAGSVSAAFLFRLSASHVKHVLIEGEWRLWHRRVVGLDSVQLHIRAAAAARATWSRMGA
jgi:cytosine/adenosine deaminase-related metal-dependent hydrolase